MGKTHRKSIIKQAIERFDTLMAIGESRFAAKQAARKEAEARGEHLWTFTTGRIHSHKTRQVYQEHTLRFVNWTRETEGIKTLEELDARADELASCWLLLEIEAQKSAYTLQMERSALRMFFGNRALAGNVPLPTRKLTDIKRSRGPVARAAVSAGQLATAARLPALGGTTPGRAGPPESGGHPHLVWGTRRACSLW